MRSFLASASRKPNILGVAALIAALSSQAVSAASALVDAARSLDTAGAMAAIAQQADVNEAEADGTTALHWAVHHDDARLVEALLQAGADPTVANDYGATPMSEAAVVGNVAIIEQLLDAGADADSPNSEGQTALMVVARTSNIEAARVLLRRGASVEAREQRKGQSALMWAAAQSRPKMVDLLIEHGADVDARSKVHQWQRQVTAEPRMKHLPSGGFTPLLYAARQGCLDCLRSLLDAGADIDLPDPDSVTPLLMALLSAHFDAARYLIERGANVNKWDWWGRTPLYAAVDYNTLPHGGRPDRPSLDQTTSLEVIEQLLEAGANPNAQLKLLPPHRSLRSDRGADSILGIGTTAMIRAARAGDGAALAALLAHGALPNLPQDGGVTPLMAAVGLYSSPIDTRGRFLTEAEAIDTAKLLLEAGADIQVRDTRGRTALHGAASKGWNGLLQFLIEHGADPAAEDVEGKTAIDAALGRLSGRRQAQVHESTAALLEELAASAAR